MGRTGLRVETSEHGGVAVLRLAGQLLPTDFLLVRDALFGAVFARPPAVVVDLTGFGAVPPEATAALLAVRQQVVEWPGVPVLLAGPDAGRAWGLPRYDTVSEAVASVAPGPPRRFVRFPLPPDDAPRFARLLVEDHCVLRGRQDVAAATGEVAQRLVGLVDQADLAPTLGVEWWRDRVVVVAGGDGFVPCGFADVRDAVAPGGAVRCGWVGTWSDSTLVWAVLDPSAAAPR
ncbi:hypothetical protein GCM10010492_58000 [Saccharothrix mutabilis subsp. mutabilis]|uniref:STAS domain-containing protein n=1 Tax=Saccharothrix mutabilis subsp. mutabilis TaxID=66855 RepID=A0ABP3E4Y7_9PSEU